jgi:hypothetical protein
MWNRPRTARLQVERLEDRANPAGPFTPVQPINPPLPEPIVRPDLIPRSPPPVEPTLRGVAVGYGSGTGPYGVRLHESRTTYQEFWPYSTTSGPSNAVHVATGDVTGDGVTDVVTGMAPIRSFTGLPVSAEPVKVFDGTTLGALVPTPVTSFHPYGSFTGGVHVACADLDGDGRAEVVVGRDGGGVGRVKVFSGADLAVGTATAVADFDGIEDPANTSGAHVATGDLNGDGNPDVLVGAGGGPRAAVFDGTTLQAGENPVKFYGDFFAFDPATFVGGIHVAVADLDGDGDGEVLAGAKTGAPRMVCYDGQDLIASGGVTRTKWWDRAFGDTASTGGLRLVGKDLDGDTRGDLVLSHGTGSRVTTIRGALVVPGGPSVLWPGQFDALAANWTTGVWVG